MVDAPARPRRAHIAERLTGGRAADVRIAVAAQELQHVGHERAVELERRQLAGSSPSCGVRVGERLVKNRVAIRGPPGREVPLAQELESVPVGSCDDVFATG
jgi:hypothetical protein